MQQKLFKMWVGHAWEIHFEHVYAKHVVPLEFNESVSYTKMCKDVLNGYLYFACKLTWSKQVQ